MKIGFDNDLYMQKQREHILERISQFNGKLYLEFGGKLFDDYHAARVLPGFQPDAKIRLLRSMADQAEIVFCISADNIEKNKIRADRLRFNLERQGAKGVVVMETDSRKLDDFFAFDKILLDAPCSGSGTLLAARPASYKAYSAALVKNSAALQSPQGYLQQRRNPSDGEKIRSLPFRDLSLRLRAG